MIVDVEGDLYRYCEQKKSVLRYSSYACDFCQMDYCPSLLNLVTLKDGLFFGCPECCKRLLLVENWRSLSYDESLNVLGL